MTVYFEFQSGPLDGAVLDEDQPYFLTEGFIHRAFESTDQGAIGRRFTCLSEANFDAWVNLDPEQFNQIPFTGHQYEVFERRETVDDVFVKVRHVRAPGGEEEE